MRAANMSECYVATFKDCFKQAMFALIGNVPVSDMQLNCMLHAFIAGYGEATLHGRDSDPDACMMFTDCILPLLKDGSLTGHIDDSWRWWL
jgi:hypothetical protein